MEKVADKVPLSLTNATPRIPFPGVDGADLQYQHFRDVRA